MNLKKYDDMIIGDTVCAVSTPSGSGGIAVVRISGPEAFDICDKVFVPRRSVKKDDSIMSADVAGEDFHMRGYVKREDADMTAGNGIVAGGRIGQYPANTVVYGSVYHNGKALDDVLVSVFRAPHSFTGEDTIEISCHGSLYIQQQLMQLLIENGARQARPGEFTQRAFMNGKMDLSQAEAVADLIASTTAGMHRLAMNQMRGGFSEDLKQLRIQLLDFTSLIELELDFGDHEELEFADRTQLRELANKIRCKIRDLADSFAAGNVIKNGIPVAIIGKPNVGKSTLLNALLNEERAIVSEMPGTTRDTIEEILYIEGQLFRFIDTAGLRDNTSDRIEALGIQRSFEKAEKASIILYLFDLTQGETEEMVSISHWLQKFNKPILMIGTKNDIARRSPIHTSGNVRAIHISCKEPADIERVKNHIIRLADTNKVFGNEVIVTNVRHYEALLRSEESIERVMEGLDSRLSGDLLSGDIRECLHYLAEITGGEIATDEVLGNIFSKFCIGK
ncbi:MAG: tRNA uridine-5-carboxymethylaminomethyl(34) synthesis GTPase MnmE [Tannerella sp.]|jgi:tRNA modification GTPase|nr:tRNA uridine-5-carboxymethylaminomethyl(34) synthesis GTPase MnmE [Tannerella sp.]